ncbi:MAG: Zn-ribbon domain-containing OB-fold protein [Candidatus Eisenbacteria bacterium]|uniref:Zn-ribbon domain-containing OB-fold protein n=1 Tax=Eiseniibacteriota bacterium TaxID=2212470 RepID=A0A948S028_UNCEI|nr:Zn-ribbon domain-containing OB-fold protein [Candidatus Eisenbacteria bacterium]MBU1947108.1 Zn-ribbon domain-containing OB-fold protein [Candidatus Eisenbacteria bacterium]MBU2691354.1 Zn-ribbon domain-containing OB-fold protein [Candidatus Eisenbacteria bacterium]
MNTSARYWREIPQRYRLEAGKCRKCGKILYPPRLVCPDCKGRDFETVILPDEGKVVSYTIIAVGPTGFTDETPYALGIIELPNGVRLMSQIVDVDLDKLSVGMPVRLEFRRLQEAGKSGILQYGHKCVPA